MKRILLSGFVALSAVSIAVVGATGAFFSDTESSVGNTFTAGAFDLKIDNESYYNGNVCQNVGTEEDPTWQWQGEADYPVPGTPCDTSFPASDLDKGFLFFNFRDLKPDDEGEDTISIHVENDAWACMDLTLTSNDDRSTTEPESAVDEEEVVEDAWDGELAQTLEFFWWADDGDNVYEEGEAQISDGVQSLLDLAPQGNSFSVALADGENNVWNPEDETPDPLPANETVYIAKAWCMGALTLAPLPQDGVNDVHEPNDVNGPGVLCDGSLLGNETQTDGVELNVMFRAEQARHNPNFLCNPDEQETATLTVNKIIVADTIGIGVEDFELHIDLEGAGGDQIVSDNVPNPGLTPGNYNVYEIILEEQLPPGVTFTATFGGACDEDGNVTLNSGDNLVCTLTNAEIIPQTILADGFGTGSTDTTFNETPTWEEGGAGATKRAFDAGQNLPSPVDGGRMAAMLAPGGYICKSINTTGYSSLALSYEWLGDTDAEAGDNGTVEYATGGTCAAPTGLATLDTHALTTTTWQSNALALPDPLDGTTFFLIFRNGANTAAEDFRIDGVLLTGVL